MLVDPGGAADVLAVIPTLGRDGDRLVRCVEAVRAQDTSARVLLAVVVNAPVATELPVGLGPDVVVLRPGFNLGWSGGLGLGRTASADARRIWLVQDDMAPDPGCLRELSRALDADPRLAIAAPVVVNAEGLVVAGSCGGVLSAPGPDLDLDHWLPAQDTPADALGDLGMLDYVPSRGMLVDLEAWDAVGGMFPGFYPVVWADVDLCAEMRATGRSFAIVPTASTRHDGQGSTPRPYGRLLYQRHRRLFAARRSPAPARPAETPVDAELTAAIARAAADLASELGTEYSRVSAELETETARGATTDAELTRARDALAVTESELTAERETRATAQRAAEMAQHDAAAAREDASRIDAELRRRTDEFRSSTSWRITRPLRMVGRALRKRR